MIPTLDNNNYCLQNYKQMQELFVVQILQPTLHYDVSLRLKPLAHENLDPDEIDKDLYSRFYHNKGERIHPLMILYLMFIRSRSDSRMAAL